MAKQEEEAIRFVATLATSDRAIQISGMNNGMTVVLEIPESEFAAAVKLLALREIPLEITVKPASSFIGFNRVR